MADWRRRAYIQADVVHFAYQSSEVEQRAEEVYLWDLDKTYLDTKFETLKGLFRAAMEQPFQKRNVPGTGELVRQLKRAWESNAVDRGLTSQPSPLPIYFITASPPQMEQRIVEKLRLDGVQPYGLFCKDNLQNLRPRRLWRLTHQLGYKLQALLQLRINLAEDVRQILWGDDSESDVFVYCLYSDICSRRLEEQEIRRTLKALKVGGPQLEKILELQARIPMQDPVEKIYINLAEDTDSEYYLKFGRRTLPTYSTFQTALDLFQDNRLSETHVVEVAQDMVTNFGFTRDELERGLDDLIRRQVLGRPSVETILPALKETRMIHEDFEPSIAPKAVSAQVGDRVLELEGSFEPWVPERIDYLHDYR
jgi:hypothetical protein